VLAQVRHGGDQDLGGKVGDHGHRRGLPQHGARTVRDRLRRVGQPVLGAAAHGEERRTRTRGPAILREIADLDVARQVGESFEQPRETARPDRSGVHRVATWRVTPGMSSDTGASGGTASRRSAPPTTPENTGAATSPP
jgi:hypothetical protein